MVAGTFNKIHPGHEKLIYAAYIQEFGTVEISMASDEYVKKYKKYCIPFEVRKHNMREYLSETYPDDWCRVFTITAFDSPFDGVDNKYINTIVCSQETLMNVLAFNKLRSARGLVETNIYCIPLTLNDFGKKLSSTELIECDES